MAATSAFAGFHLFPRRRALVGVRTSTAADACAARANIAPLQSLSHPPLPSVSLYRRICQQWHPAAAAADTYYDDHSDGSDGGGREGESEGWNVTAAPGKGGTRTGDAGRRLYVGNLPYSMTPSQLAEVFLEAGTVASVEVVYDRLTDRSRGFAFVTMGGADEARSAIGLFDGAQVGGRTMKVNFPEVPRGGEREVMGPRIRESRRGFVDSPHKIYAGNLSWTVSSDSLRGAFAGCPGMLGARVVYERDTGRSRGYGFVSFASAEDVRSALDAMDGLEVEGRPLRLNAAINNGGGSSSSSLVPKQVDRAAATLSH